MTDNHVSIDSDGFPINECVDCDYSVYDYNRGKWICVCDDICDLDR